jgi:hypothetical protein
VVLDGTLIPVGRVAADRLFYSGKHKKHRMTLQVIASPDGDILWVPGSVHDKRAEWIWGVLAELEAAGLVTLADKGYQGSTWAKTPYKGKNKPESQKEANRIHARAPRPRRTGKRAAQGVEDSQQAPLLPLARRPTRQGHPRPGDSGSISRIKKLTGSATPPTQISDGFADPVPPSLLPRQLARLLHQTADSYRPRQYHERWHLLCGRGAC